MSQIARKDNLRNWGGTTSSTAVVVIPIPFIALNPPDPIKTDGGTPNEVTIQAMRDAQAGKNLIRCKSAGEMFRKLGI